MKSNINGWRDLHAKGRYYDVHPNYQKKDKRKDADLLTILSFFLTKKMNVAIIGSGYGRETALIAPLVRKVYAIDVGEVVFRQMRAFLGARKITNVVAVNAENWIAGIPPDEIDFVYSIVTLQHLTRDLATSYVRDIFPMMKTGGRALIQFSESPTGTFDAEDVAIEPNVRWTEGEIRALIANAGFEIYEIRSVSGVGGTREARPWTWHWAFFGRGDRREG